MVIVLIILSLGVLILIVCANKATNAMDQLAVRLVDDFIKSMIENKDIFENYTVTNDYIKSFIRCDLYNYWNLIKNGKVLPEPNTFIMGADIYLSHNPAEKKLVDIDEYKFNEKVANYIDKIYKFSSYNSIDVSLPKLVKK